MVRRFYLSAALLGFCYLSAQITIAGAQDFAVDDYGEVYISRAQDFSLTKYDSLGMKTAEQMFTLPFRILSVQNPLEISLFSQNAQDLRYFDRNLNEIRKISFRNLFGNITSVFPENSEQIWLMESAGKRLMMYSTRTETVQKSFPLELDFEKIRDFQVYKNQIYLLLSDRFMVMNLGGRKIFEEEITNGRKLRRENKTFYIITKTEIYKYSSGGSFEKIYFVEKSDFVDKNSTSFIALKEGRLIFEN